MKTYEVSNKSLYYVEYDARAQKMYIEASGLETVLDIVVERAKSAGHSGDRTSIIDSIGKIERLPAYLYKECIANR